ncbi:MULTISPECIES: FAD-dependent oxidoreductase [unclassified Leifsonia]|uniref:NAD(P)/FAD-dependent oxidoreductase n=1 Tax=unclassified Leifsonia TaxID=2663824 RepID=UPI0008A73936|nr:MULTISPECIES: FAD-dependent oxidoreductase [unclassified Leifsonia]SEI02559.1 Reductase C-terminal [Leifsonia sp. CL154]SFL71489.1 Reductase C-terminal [Leifsonia sp. CL147]
MNAISDIAIVGAALAGATAAKTLRDEGYDGRIHLFGAERHAPYIRPPLSKGYLAGSDDRASIDVLDASWYLDNNVDLHLGTRVSDLDPSGSVTTDDGTRYRFDRALLATGSTPRRLPIPGADLDGVVSLRTVDDSDRLRDTLQRGGRRIVLIGSGWIGMEVAATARTLGNEVTILERDPVPLAAALGDELGRFFARLHAEHDVRIRTSVAVESIVGENGHATGVRLADGETFPADLVVIGVGAVPLIELAERAGLDTGDGVLVDASLRTSAPAVFAAGDIAGAVHPLIDRRIRSEHWANAIDGGTTAARAMLGRPVTHDAIPYFYTDQFDLGMEYAGFAPLTRDAELVYRGDPASGEFIAFWLREGRVVAGMNVNIWDVNDDIKALVRSGEVVSLDALRDPNVPLDSLAASTSAR